MDCCHDPADFCVHRCDKVAPATRAGVHALVIGTGQYRYKHKGTTDYDDFADINGASFGAGKFAKFLRDEYHDPLGHGILTVRLLLTPTGREDPALKKLGVTWQPATYGKVRAALRDWYDDCDKSAENITILYAAGHGVSDLHSFTHV